jgi:hypothetical protein
MDALMHRHLCRLWMTTIGSPYLRRCHRATNSVVAVLWPKYHTPQTHWQHVLWHSSVLKGSLLLDISYSPRLPSGRQMPSRMKKARPTPQRWWSYPDQTPLVQQKAIVVWDSPPDPWCTMPSCSRLSRCMDCGSLRLLEMCSLLKINTCAEQGCPYAVCFLGGRTMVRPWLS